MVKVVVVQMEKQEKVTEDTVDTKKPTHGLGTNADGKIHSMDELDPKAPLFAAGVETTLTPEILCKIMELLPNKMTPASLTFLFVNIMAAYDQCPNSPMFIMALLDALRSLRQEHPELFEEGGYRRMVEQAVAEREKRKN